MDGKGAEQLTNWDVVRLVLQSGILKPKKLSVIFSFNLVEEYNEIA